MKQSEWRESADRWRFDDDDRKLFIMLLAIILTVCIGGCYAVNVLNEECAQMEER